MVAYNRCLQISFILVQLGFIAFGGVMVGVGVWLEIEEESYSDIVTDDNELLIGPYLIVAAGCAIVVLAIVGMVGAFYDHAVNRFLLYLYIVLVVIVFAAQAAGGIIAFVYREEVLDRVREGLNETIVRYNEDTRSGRSITEAWDDVQEQLECCGINNVSDWLNIIIPDDIPGGNGTIPFPVSCCRDGTEADPPDNPCLVENTYSDGCEEALTDFLEDNLLVVASIGISFVVAEVVVVLMAFCLVCCTDFE